MITAILYLTVIRAGTPLAWTGRFSSLSNVHRSPALTFLPGPPALPGSCTPRVHGQLAQASAAELTSLQNWMLLIKPPDWIISFPVTAPAPSCPF